MSSLSDEHNDNMNKYASSCHPLPAEDNVHLI